MIFHSTLLVPVENWNKMNISEWKRAEDASKDYFSRLGFTLYKIEPNMKIEKDFSRLLNILHIPEDIISSGVPDFLIWNKKIFFFVECKYGKSQPNENQSNWLGKYGDQVDILVLRVKGDFNNYIEKSDPAMKGFSHLKNENMNVIQTFWSTGCGKRFGKNNKKPKGESRLVSHTENIHVEQPSELAYLQLANMEYANRKLVDSRMEIAQVLRNKDLGQGKYRTAYENLRRCTDNFSSMLNYHRDKAMEHLSKVIKPDIREKLLIRSRQETESKEMAYGKNQEELYPLDFRPATDYLGKSDRKDK
ncbi:MULTISPECIES: hypothetical protein [Ferroplasma]|uniref:hypothetical protein n=1 Tax=Ferroplasma TaxID=74968 RepID=UPI0023F362B3|nr:MULTISPECIES: hypothetical protein [Ferroplasma]